jgi:hypothetical protein
MTEIPQELREQKIAFDSQIEKKIRNIIMNNVWVSLECGQVHLEHTDIAAEKIRKLFEDLRDGK